jgi:large subunit ribosomal protein L6
MSRIGLKPIPVPGGVKVNIEGSTVTVESGKNKMSHTFEPGVSIKIENNTVMVSRAGDDRFERSSHGLSRTLLANMIEGVSKGFQKTLEINGVGYRAQKSDKGITLQIGFCHTVDFAMPKGTEAVIEGTNKIHVKGIDKELVGQTAASIRDLRPADDYKGKGIVYAGEKIKLKPGKAGKTALRRQ